MMNTLQYKPVDVNTFGELFRPWIYLKPGAVKSKSTVFVSYSVLTLCKRPTTSIFVGCKNTAPPLTSCPFNNGHSGTPYSDVTHHLRFWGSKVDDFHFLSLHKFKNSRAHIG
jgi:hypothetical protein